MSSKSDSEFFYQKVAANVALLGGLVKKLPKSVPVAKTSDRVVEIFTNRPVPVIPKVGSTAALKTASDAYWEVFNGRMDVLFGEDHRNSKTGRLPNIFRGKHGMVMVLSYLQSTVKLKPEGFPWSAAMAKVLRLVNELKALVPNSVSSNRSDGRKGAKENIDGHDGDTKDSDYALPKKPRPEDEDDVPSSVYDSDGVELMEETEQRKELNQKRKERGERGSPGKTKGNKRAKNGTAEAPITFDSAEESDGQTALRQVEEEEGKPRAARRGPHNQSMQHFREPVPVVGSGKELRWKFFCKFCPCARTFPRTVSQAPVTFDREPTLPVGFNNLASHLSKCGPYKKYKERKENLPDDAPLPAGNIDPGNPIMREFLRRGKENPAIPPSQKGFLRIFAAWILDDDLPWTTGESNMLANLFKYLQVSYTLPSDTTVRNELAKIFAELHKLVVKELARIKSKFVYATDTWTTKQMVYSFACSIAYFINDEWELIERIIDFRPLESKDHEGVHAAYAFVEGARKAGALSKITITMDNASVNDVLFRNVSRALLTLYDIPEREDSQIRCLAHIINLVSQAILSSLDEAEECVEDGDEFDYFLMNKDLPIHYSVNDDVELQDLESNREQDLDLEVDEEGEECREEFEKELAEKETKDVGESALKRLRFIVNKITSSPQRRQRFWKITMDVYGRGKRVDDKDPKSTLLSKLMVIRDVRTRWNSTHAMIGRALILREAINRWVLLTDEYQSLLLTKNDWTRLEQIRKALDCFTVHTQQLSMAKCPTIPFVLPIYDAMEKHLDNVTGNLSFDMDLRLAAGTGKQKLMKYKKSAVKNHNYILGTVLHPFMRAEWFRKTVPNNPDPEIDLKQKNDAVNHVKILVKAVAEVYQAEMLEEARKPVTSSSQVVTPSDEGTSLSRSHSLASLCDFDFDIPESSAPTPQQQLAEELHRYFAFEGGRGLVHNPLLWWKEHEALFPILARLARDILAIPATSVSVERTFSKSRGICTDLRSSLKAETVREALLTKLWIRSELFELVKKPEPVEKHGSKRLLELSS